MANQEQLAMLRMGPEAWNQWRADSAAVVVDLVEADLSGEFLHGADLSSADLTGSSLRGAYLIKADLAGSNLEMADLGRADLSKANLSGAHLSKADLKEAYLNGACLSRAYLIQTNLSGANLSNANLSRANLARANLSGANITGVDLNMANLYQADLSGTRMGNTMLGDVDLSMVNGLASITHIGPSIIGIDTIFRSQGKIDEGFMRGAGVPDIFITYMGSLTSNAFDFYSCFISYSTKDQEFADRLYADLQAKGVRCWFAPEDVQGGKKLHEQLYEAIRMHDKLLLVLSPHSLQSEWVMTEIRRTRRLELEEKRRKLFPIRLVDYTALKQWECFDADTGKDLAIEVREFFIPDFSTWKDHDSYKRAFDLLLRDLKQGKEI